MITRQEVIKIATGELQNSDFDLYFRGPESQRSIYIEFKNDSMECKNINLHEERFFIQNKYGSAFEWCSNAANADYMISQNARSTDYTTEDLYPVSFVKDLLSFLFDYIRNLKIQLTLIDDEIVISKLKTEINILESLIYEWNDNGYYEV